MNHDDAAYRSRGMTRCKVETHAEVCLLVTFPDHPRKSLLLQGDDRYCFGVNCGIPALGVEDTGDWTDIENCPAEYLDVADID